LRYRPARLTTYALRPPDWPHARDNVTKKENSWPLFYPLLIFLRVHLENSPKFNPRFTPKIISRDFEAENNFRDENKNKNKRIARLNFRHEK
jgi:hypothetical protein